MQLSETNRNVFINCPFDADYRACFEALLFTVMVSGYRVRCALEDDDAANIRFDKLRRLIRESPRTIHDLSRTELGENELPRFNMPFELGLAMGAKHFGGPKRRKNTALIMVRERYALPAYLSDLGGNDPTAHGAIRTISCASSVDTFTQHRPADCCQDHRAMSRASGSSKRISRVSRRDWIGTRRKSIPSPIIVSICFSWPSS
jgi:hypothetical protein